MRVRRKKNQMLDYRFVGVFILLHN